MCGVCDWLWFLRSSHSPLRLRRVGIGACVCCQVLTGALFLGVAGRVVAVGVQGLRPLLAGRVAGLVGVPGLFAVVAELCAAAFSATNQPGTAGTARGDDGKPERRDKGTSQDTIFYDKG